MEVNYNEEERYFRAKKKVQEIKGFYGHLISFVSVNIFLFTINVIYSPKEIWFFWTTIGWGIGLFFHWAKVFGYSPFFNKEWEERKINEFMKNEKSNKNKWE